MKITLDVPDTTMCAGIFVNYKTKRDINTGCFTTTNALIDCANYSGVKINDNGTLVYKKKRRMKA